jgi:TRAP transporter TAXI family solute receptor
MGSAGSGTEIIGNRTLEAYGLDPAKDIQRERLGVADSASALGDNKIDAFFWSGGLPTAAVLNLANATKLRFIDLSESIAKMSSTYGPFYVPVKIPAGIYKDNPEVTVSGVANVLVVNAKFDAALAKAILTTMFDNKSDLEVVHSEAKNLKLETATVGSPITFHQGAIDFYKAKGAWKQ